jgi:hypothetical protein
MSAFSPPNTLPSGHTYPPAILTEKSYQRTVDNKLGIEDDDSSVHDSTPQLRRELLFVDIQGEGRPSPVIEPTAMSTSPSNGLREIHTSVRREEFSAIQSLKHRNITSVASDTHGSDLKKFRKVGHI